MSRRRANTDSGMLAKLMAQENLNVVNDPNITMSKLDVKNRVLSMPVLKEMSGTVYEGFTAKEVGKALYSEQDQFSAQRANLESQQEGMGAILDILEEARTQNLVEQKFPGTVGVNSRFYSEMWQKDMFKVRDRSIDDLHFMDRLNLERKVGHIARPDFNEAEQAFVDRSTQIKTFEESMSLSQDILNYLYTPEPPKPEDEDPENGDGDGSDSSDENGNGEGGGSGGDGSDQDENQDESNENDDGSNGGSGIPEGGEGEEEGNSQSQKSGGGNSPEGGRLPAEKMPPKIETNSNFDESFADSEVDESKQGSHTLFISEQKNPDACVELLKDTLKRWKGQIDKEKLNANHNTNYNNVDLIVDEYYNRFIEETKPTIQYMKKQFDQMKQADAHKRTRTAKSGKLDTRKLMFYKTTEDIFKASKRVKDGKSHGMFMMMDMSGSMQGSRLYATIRQTLLMVLFCRAINIPFNVYSFTTGGYHGGSKTVRMDVNPSLPTLEYNTRDVKLVEYLNSGMGKSDFKFAFKCLLREALMNKYPESMKNVGSKRDFFNTCEMLENMGGTPTTEALNVMSGQMTKFKEANKIEVLNTILLTDGDCSSVTFSKIGYASSIGDGSVVVDNKTKRKYLVDDYNKGRFNKTMNSIMCNIVKERTGCNLISIRIGCERSSNNSLDDLCNNMSSVEKKKITNSFKSKGSVAIPYKGVDKYIVSLDNDIVTDEKISSDAANLKKEFGDISKRKKNSKILANLILESIVAKLS